VLEKSTTSCFLEKRGKTEESPAIFEGGLGILGDFGIFLITIEFQEEEKGDRAKRDRRRRAAWFYLRKVVILMHS
jgi:hypothetical protein